MKPIRFDWTALCLFVLAFAGFGQVACGQSSDTQLRRLLKRNGMESLDPGGGHSQARIDLGQALFFDRELSGNRDTSCATCHHPLLASGDALSLPVGTAPENPGILGPDRIKGADREFVPRNAPEIFNRGYTLWTSMFWDGRVAELDDGSFETPAGDQLLAGLTSVVYIQAMLPVTSRDEMRGKSGDLTFEGDVNEIALIADSDLHGIWTALMGRLMAIQGYRDLFAAAYPEKSPGDLTFADAANAIGAFEISAFTMLDSPFDRYLAGENSALTQQQKRGASLFYGQANCASCHSGPLMTDQKHWGLAVPQLGPGKAPFTPRDAGRFAVDDNFRNAFAFRTPPLRNVAATGPYMHNGAFKDLKSVIRHHAQPVLSLLSYSPGEQLEQTAVRSSVLHDWQTLLTLTLTLDASRLPRRLSNSQINDLAAFLESLTAPDLHTRLLQTIPSAVPSGLPVEGN